MTGVLLLFACTAQPGDGGTDPTGDSASEDSGSQDTGDTTPDDTGAPPDDTGDDTAGNQGQVLLVINQQVITSKT
ncbi:MAG: hypothetical protein GXP62_17655 [Oligoflexia bacterium]|nr:hypothetical protein [Oligoflexia bacterium]